MKEIIDDEQFSQARINAKKNSDDFFRSEQINFLQSTVELVRNKFVFERIDYEKITEIEIKDGYLIKNRWIIRALSVLVIYYTGKFLLYGLSVSGGFAKWHLAQWFNKGSLIALWGPLLILIGAALAMYQSFIKSPVMNLKTNDAAHTVRIKKLEENKTLDELVSFLKGKRLSLLDQRKKKQ
jgi:hypothetical protein